MPDQRDSDKIKTAPETDYTFPQRLVLSEEAWAEICDLIENPRQPTPAMLALFRR